MDKTTEINLPQIIGITGRKFNGKDTLAEYLVKNHKYEQLAFAKPIKDISKILFGFNEQQLYGSLKETIDDRWNVTPRTVMQYIGTEMFRKMMGNVVPELGEDFWVKCLMEQIKSKLKENPNVKLVISDVRFANEIDAIKTFNDHLLLRVSRPSINNNVDVHESESFIEKLTVDHEILNDSTIDSLYDKFDKLINIL
jgi:hypothetical protein